jgi:Flp pilus assembly protein TadG
MFERLRTRLTHNLGESGVAALELALATPVLLLMVTGSADFGRILYQEHRLAAAARAGTQYAMQSSSTWIDTTNITAAVRADANDTTAQSLTVTSSVCTCPNGTAVCSTGTNCSGSTIAGTYVKVTVSTSYSTLLRYPFIARPISLSGRSLIRVQ